MVNPQEQALQALVDRLTLEEKVHLLTGQDSWSTRALPAIGLHSMVMSDGPAGVRGRRWDERDASVNFPSPTAIAASWDRGAVHAIGEGLGSEARRKGVHVVLAPTINLHRTPYGGRHFEAFSEDPVLTSELAVEYVRGIQSRGVGATVKHYVANDSETDRFTVDVRVDDRTLRELYLAAFEGPVVDGGCWLVMSAYNSINGATATENQLLTTPLQDEWGFDGVVVSDWTAVRSIASARHPQDVAMPGPQGAWGDRLVDAVRAGEVDEASIDRKVRRVLRLAARVGALDGLDTGGAAPAVPMRAHRPLARSAAREGMVLLANDGILPLRAPRSIALIGEGAQVARTQGGGSATVVPADVVSPLEGLRRRWPASRVEWARGAVVQQGLSPLESGTFTAPDGRAGLRARFLAADGSELGREHREASSLVWFDGPSTATAADVVELSFRWTPDPATTRLGLAGLADAEVLVDGATVASVRMRTGPDDDPATAVLNPPSTVVQLPPAGDGADVVVRFRPVPGGIPDGLALRVGLPATLTDPAELIAEAAGLAASADVAVVVVGTSNEVESEGFDRTSLALPGAQDDLVRAVAAANPRTVVVVNSGAPVTLPWRDEVAAALAVWFPGQEFGDALADVLSGDAEPGGRLPVTWPGDEQDVPVREVTPVDGVLVYREGLHIGDRAWRRAGVTPAYPFGHGLGYTTWELSDLVAVPADQHGATASCSVMNTGARAGKCVVQLYVERPHSALDRPARWLAGFEVVRLEPGQRQQVAVPIPRRRLAHWDGAGWAVEPGGFRVVAGLSSADDRLTTDLAVEPVVTPTPGAGE